MRLIDADELKEHAWRDKLDSRELIAEMINNAPTVKVISTNIPISIFERLNSQEPCEDAISRTDVKRIVDFYKEQIDGIYRINESVDNLPSVTPKPKMGHCKDCKYFEYNSVAKVDGVPLIVAHEICSRWGDGCKTSENGYCFLFEPKMQEVEDNG